MQTRPVAAPQVMVEELDSEICLYRPDTDEVLVLNQTAGDIWRLADGELTSEGIVEALADFYAQDQAVVRAAVEQVLDDLVDRGYLVSATDMPA